MVDVAMNFISKRDECAAEVFVEDKHIHLSVWGKEGQLSLLLSKTMAKKVLKDLTHAVKDLIDLENE